MSDEQIIPTEVVNPPAEVVPPEEADPYTKTDDGYEVVIDLGDGSGIQKFTGRTQKEVSRKLVEAQVNATRKIRSQERLLKLGAGTPEKPLTPDTEEALPEFKQQVISAEEQVELIAELQSGDPARVIAAQKRLIEAELGASFDTVRNTLRLTPEIQAGIKARLAGEQFVAAHPEYAPTLENAQTIMQWLQKRNLPPTLKNFEIAYVDLTENSSGLLELVAVDKAPATPVVVETTQPQVTTPPATETARIEPTVTTRPRPGSTSISDRGTSARPDSAPAAGTSIQVWTTVIEKDASSQKMVQRRVLVPLTAKSLDRMSTDDYRFNIAQTKDFLGAVNKLLEPKQ